MDQSWAVFLGGLGFGSAITACVQHSLTRMGKRQDLILVELKEAFTGFLAAFAKLNENDASRENQVNFALWVARIQLVASSRVNVCIQTLQQTKSHSSQRATAINEMLKEMRSDLGISRDS